MFYIKLFHNRSRSEKIEHTKILDPRPPKMGSGQMSPKLHPIETWRSPRGGFSSFNTAWNSFSECCQAKENDEISWLVQVQGRQVEQRQMSLQLTGAMMTATSVRLVDKMSTVLREGDWKCWMEKYLGGGVGEERQRSVAWVYSCNGSESTPRVTLDYVHGRTCSPRIPNRNDWKGFPMGEQ